MKIKSYLCTCFFSQRELQEEVYTPEVLSESDTSTGFQQSMKALGDMNPQTLKYKKQSPTFTNTVNVQGGNILQGLKYINKQKKINFLLLPTLLMYKKVNVTKLGVEIHC